MRCTYWQKQILEALDAGLSTQAEEQLQCHLQACPSCAKNYAWQKAIQSALRKSKPIKAPEHFNQGVWEKIQAPPVSISRPWRWLPATAGALGLAVAAAALVVVSYQSIHLKSLSQSQMSVQVANQPTPRLTPDEQQEAHVLPTQVQVVKPSPGYLVQEAAKKQKSIQASQAHETETVLVADVPEPVAQSTPSERQEQAEAIPRYVSGLSRQGKQGNTSLKNGNLANKAQVPETAANKQAQGNAQGFGTIRLLNNTIHLNRQERTRLEVMLDQPKHIQARIFSREGRLIKNIIDQDLPAGLHTLEWDGTNDSGDRSASGIYVLILQDGQEEKKFKLAVIK